VSLLALEHVDKRYRSGQRERVALADVSLELQPGELVVALGPRRSGRTTLLRVAAGIELPDDGTVSFRGRELATYADGALGNGIGYVQKAVRAGEEQGVLEQVAAPLLARGLTVGAAHSRGRAAPARSAAGHCAAARIAELSTGETIRVAIARTLALSPELLVIDEPAAGVELSARDEILALLRTLAGDGLAVLASTGEPTELAGAHRALTLSDGELRGPSVPQLASVVALRRPG
jgi:ABC-type lipoprotein export system ATPase subunit